jgi:hypothetical protein
MKKIRFLLFLAFFASSGFVLLPIAYDSASFLIYQHTNEAIVRMHLRFIPDEKFDQELRIAIDEDDIEVANQIHEIGLEQHVDFDEALLQRLDDANSTWSTFSRHSKEAWNGAWHGEVKSSTGLAGSVISDFSGAGDFRDLANELKAYPDYDSFTVGLSLFGITASAITLTSFTSGGAATPAGIKARITATTLKVIRASGRISKKLEKAFSGHADKIINKKTLGELSTKIKNFDLKNADRKQLDELSTLAKSTVNTNAVKPLTEVAGNMSVIGNNAGFVGLSRGLAVADDFSDISRLAKVSKVTKAKFAGTIKMAPKLAKPVLKVLRILYEAIAFLIGALLWVISATWYLMKTLRFIFF